MLSRYQAPSKGLLPSSLGALATAGLAAGYYYSMQNELAVPRAQFEFWYLVALALTAGLGTVSP